MEGTKHAAQARVQKGFLGAELRGEAVERPAARSAAADFAKGRVLRTPAKRVKLRDYWPVELRPAARA
jgi:hypothetical protein